MVWCCFLTSKDAAAYDGSIGDAASQRVQEELDWALIAQLLGAGQQDARA